MVPVFVGIDPNPYSIEHGHYFTRHTSRFWPAFSGSCPSEHIQDVDLLPIGIGLTDVVKIPTTNASQVTPAMYAERVQWLFKQLAHAAPWLAVIHGVTGYQPSLRLDLPVARKMVKLGAQPEAIGATRLYFVPIPVRQGPTSHGRIRLHGTTAWGISS